MYRIGKLIGLEIILNKFHIFYALRGLEVYLIVK